MERVKGNEREKHICNSHKERKRGKCYLSRLIGIQSVYRQNVEKDGCNFPRNFSLDRQHSTKSRSVLKYWPHVNEK